MPIAGTALAIFIAVPGFFGLERIDLLLVAGFIPMFISLIYTVIVLCETEKAPAMDLWQGKNFSV